MKRCQQCQLVKDEDEFHRDSRRADGRKSDCRECRRKKKREDKIRREEKRIEGERVSRPRAWVDAQVRAYKSDTVRWSRYVEHHRRRGLLDQEN